MHLLGYGCVCVDGYTMLYLSYIYNYMYGRSPTIIYDLQDYIPHNVRSIIYHGLYGLYMDYMDYMIIPSISSIFSDLWDHMDYPLVICYIAIEHGHRNVVSSPINSMVIFHSYVTVYQRV